MVDWEIVSKGDFMLRSSKALKGYFILAQDGEIGRLNDFFFDDDYWIMRYIVVARTWLCVISISSITLE